MENQRFIDFVAEIITNETFMQQDQKHKEIIYTRIQELYDARLQAKYEEGHHRGYLDALKKSRAILNGE